MPELQPGAVEGLNLVAAKSPKPFYPQSADAVQIAIRLTRLELAGLVEKVVGGFVLTQLGRRALTRSGAQ